MSTRTEFGSRNEHWHPGETPEYVAEAVQRVRARLNLPHTRDVTLSTITAVPSASETLASLDRDALHTTFWSAAHTPAARQRRALEMREAGYTMAAIARELGYRSASGARYAVEAARTRREGARDVA